MTTVSFVSGKGGVGKSTLSFLFATALSGTGKRVAIRDLDPQKSLTDLVTKTGVANPEIEGEEYDYLIIDVPPRIDDASVLAAVAIADRVIVPCLPSPIDIPTAQAAAGVVSKLLKKGATGRMVFNNVEPGTNLFKILEGIDFILPPLKATLSKRHCYRMAVVGGWRVLDSKAKAEVTQLVMESLL